jgi:ABC-2 type transport system ATP-binding protein
MPVGQLLNFSASVCGARVQRMLDVARRLGLDPEELKHRPFVKLSGGQKQKLLISIALGRDSQLLIMDEPAANLDPEARHIFFNLLAEKQEESVMLISSHRLDEVASLVNRVVEMDQGRVVLDDKVADRVALNAQLRCTLRLVRAEEAFHKAITQWGFHSGDGGLNWQGVVAAPDRLRFLGVLSRYAGLLSGVQLEEESSNAA